MDRLAFYNSISGIDYPDMIVKFFDQFAALHSMISVFKSIAVDGVTEDSISFIIEFPDSNSYGYVAGYPESIIVYGRPLAITKEAVSNLILRITIK